MTFHKGKNKKNVMIGHLNFMECTAICNFIFIFFLRERQKKKNKEKKKKSGKERRYQLYQNLVRSHFVRSFHLC